MSKHRYWLLVGAFVLSTLFVCAQSQDRAQDRESDQDHALTQPSTAPENSQQQEPDTAGQEEVFGSQPVESRSDESQSGRAQSGDAKSADATSEEAARADRHRPVVQGAISNPVLWHMPENIAELNLYYGQGGEERQPQPPFVFLAEDRNGTSPKCDVRDANRKTWRVKLGPEARPEVVASRLLWAVGYFVNDDYVLPEAQIKGLKMKRKSPKMHGTVVTDARFSRKPGGLKKVATWQWRNNPFTGTREFNGLRVMMAVMNNWDLKDSNNAVYADRKDGSRIYLVSDVGASLGANRFGFSRSHAKGNLDSFEESKFIVRTTPAAVDFGTPSPPRSPLAMAAGFGEIMYAARAGLDWIGKNIPIDDARWMGNVLSQLSHQQLEDAFRAGNFPADEIDSYVYVMESRIEQLKGL